MPVWEVDLTDAKRARLRNKLDTHVEEEKFDTFLQSLKVRQPFKLQQMLLAMQT